MKKHQTAVKWWDTFKQNIRLGKQRVLSLPIAVQQTYLLLQLAVARCLGFR